MVENPKKILILSLFKTSKTLIFNVLQIDKLSLISRLFASKMLFLNPNLTFIYTHLSFKQIMISPFKM